MVSTSSCYKPVANVTGVVRLAGMLLPAGLEAMTWNV